MKKVLCKLFICIFCCVLQSSCFSAQAYNYSNVAIQAYNSGVIFYQQKKYELAEQKYIQALKIQPNFSEAKNNLGIIYQDLSNKSFNNQDYDNAIYYTKKYLELYPNNEVVKKNLQVANFRKTEKNLNDSINNLNIGHIAPEQLCSKIRVQPGADGYYYERMKTILDLIWSEPNGKFLLSALLKQNNTFINITNGYTKADVHREQQKKTLYLYFIIPVASFTTNSAVNINFPISYIDNFNNKKLFSSQRIYNLQVFIHEFGHAFIGIKKPKDTNSIEEELGVSMIGYNIANKIIAGEYLTKEQTKEYSENCLISLLSDEHQYLPVYSGFNKSIQKHGVVMPYPEIYSDITAIYKKLLAEGKVKHTQTLDAQLIKENSQNLH